MVSGIKVELLTPKSFLNCSALELLIFKLSEILSVIVSPPIFKLRDNLRIRFLKYSVRYFWRLYPS